MQNNSTNDGIGSMAVSVFCRPVWVAVFALTAATLWGWAYPLIKLGFGEFGITATMTAAKMLFAGIRFLVAGVVVLAVARCLRQDFRPRQRGIWPFVLAFSVVNTSLHYAFFYFGLSHSAGARAAILNSVSVFATVIMACVFFATDRFTWRKWTGCALGFLGILALNVGGAEIGGFTWLGDGMIVLNALCGATAALMTRGLGRRVNVMVGTGYSLAIGGATLIVPALLMGGTLPVVTTWGVADLAALVLISSVGFVLYNKLLTLNPVGKVAIYNSLIPVIGAVTSCLCLGEQFYYKYVAAALLAAVGIYIINAGRR